MQLNTIYVSKDGFGFSTLQEAVCSIDDEHTEQITINVRPGIYTEKVFIRKENIRIVGEDPLTTIFRYGQGARQLRQDGSELGTFNTAVLLIAGRDLFIENITIENTAGPGHIAGQAVAAYVASDRTSFVNCRFIGYQDTIFTGDAITCDMKRLILPDFFVHSKIKIDYAVNRNYFKNCYITGDVDYIFGPNTAYFDQCQIVTRSVVSEDGGYITAASTPPEQEFGYVFNECLLEGMSGVKNVYLGRPWRDYAKTVFLNCKMDGFIHPKGWHNWGRVKAEVTTGLIELMNYGEGASATQRAAFSKQLDNPDLVGYFSKKNVLAGEDQWLPN